MRWYSEDHNALQCTFGSIYAQRRRDILALVFSFYSGNGCIIEDSKEHL